MTEVDSEADPPGSAAPISRVEAAAYTIPLEQTESDGTLTWSATTIVIVRVCGGGHLGVGYTYAPAAAARIVEDTMASVVEGRDVLAPGRAWDAMARAVRNQGLRGPVAAALSAVDVALWDLKARVLEIPLVALLDGYHEGVPAYGSGGFTNFDDRELGRRGTAGREDQSRHRPRRRPSQSRVRPTCHRR